METVLQEEFGRRVVLEEGGQVVRKTFVEDARRLADEELRRLERFFAALAGVPGATCPAPLGPVDDGFRMSRVAGEELVAVLGGEDVGDERLLRFAATMAAALRAYVAAVGEPYRDFKLDNVLWDRATDTLAFLDFGAPQDVGAPAPGDSPIEVSMGNFVASVVFESARPDHLLRPRLHRQSVRLASELARLLDPQLRADRFLAAARRDYRRATSERGPLYAAWYATVGFALGRRIPLPQGRFGPIAPWARG